jgi:two-component system CheB/CheR fusion protein
MDIGNIAWWEWDLVTNKVAFDDKKATMIGYSPEEFPDDVFEICKLIHPDDL